MYTDVGMFTRELSYEYYRNETGPFWNFMHWSLYWISGSPVWANSLFIVAAICAVMMIVGKWTRVATVASWVLLTSLQMRNPLVITSGDFLIKMMLFWSMFLPLGARWSLDAGRRQKVLGATATGQSQPSTFVSLATLGFTIQLVIAYLFPGLAKLNEIWFSGEAMSYVLRLDIYITPFGRSLLDHPGLLKFTTWATLVAELGWIWTLFIPWKNDWFRLSNLVIFWLFHIGIGLSMSIGLFPLICMVAWLPLLPTIVWERRNYSETFQSAFAFAGQSIGFRFGQVICGLVCVLVVAWNLTNLEPNKLGTLRNTILAPIVLRLGIDHYFLMFGKPPAENPWFVYEAKLADGTEFDIFRSAPIDYDRPEWVKDMFPTFHWRKVHRNLVDDRLKYMRQPLMEYVVEKWNRTHPPEKQVVRLRLLCFLEDIGPDYNPLNRRSVVWASYTNPQLAPGSIFDSIGEKTLDKPF